MNQPEADLHVLLGRLQDNLLIRASMTYDGRLDTSQVFEELRYFFPDHVAHVEEGQQFMLDNGVEVGVIIQNCPSLNGFMYATLGETDVEFMKYSHFRKLVHAND